MGHQPYLTVKDLPSLKLHIQRAKEEGKDEFIFKTLQGREVPMYVPYASYCVEYLESQDQKKDHGH